MEHQERESSYLIGNRTFRVVFASLPGIAADALVSSDDNYLTMGGGVSAALRHAAGPAVEMDAGKHTPLKLGDVAVTTAGKLKARYIFHGVTLDLDGLGSPDESCLRAIVDRCLELAEALRLRRVAFPALGTGTAQFPYELAGQAMTKAVADFLSRRAEHVHEVTLALHAFDDRARTDTELFYRRAAGIAAQWTDSRRLGELIDELRSLLARTPAGSLHDQAAAIRGDVAAAETALAGDRWPAVTGAGRPSESLSRASDAAGDIADRSAAEVDWEDRQARETVLQVRLQSLRTQHNILLGSRNQLEERQARYGPLAVPLEVVNELRLIEEQLTAKEEQILRVKTELVQLAGGAGRRGGAL
ncbi:macro domain-containing protein [Couchioplanes caeruleus]|uniref:macro domain-containing protein n=1 Tax=Couchioplanes caeruleus TaxID=56438 RepID=UPI0020C0E4B4|nr:macro domain-containing protein [Couchioplanes caeruleus]UQU68189.1 macro domain-containing protein [Couchioplanes caeruleus]